MSVLLTIEQAANRLAVSERQLRRWRDEGRGPVPVRLNERVIRYDADDLDQHIEKMKTFETKKASDE